MLKGTGIGLTPAGDDFIAGLLWGLHFNEYRTKKNLMLLKDAVYNAAKGSNPLTNSFLFNAKNEYYFYLLKNFLYLSIHKEGLQFPVLLL